MTSNFITDISARIELFRQFLIRSGMDHKQYQEDGVRWCITNELRPDPPVNVRGGFIADEMGLGKTILMIGTFVANMIPKTLIILPPVLIQQWAHQIKRTTGHKPIIFHGAGKKYITIEQLKNAPIVLSTYNIISITDKQMKKGQVSLLHEVKWNRIVFDEGHHLRNGDTARLFGAKLLRTKIRWIVSGTPVQNNKKDFHNLCQVLKMPFDFYTDNANLPIIARDFILKRTKKQVGIILPDVNIVNGCVFWKSETEKNISEEIHTILQMASQKKKNRVSAIIEGMSGRGAILTAMMRARQSCILPKLMNKMFNSFVLNGYMDNFESYKEGLSYSSKLDAVVTAILSKKSNGSGKLVFCHFREEIDEIRKRLQEGGILTIASFDGRVGQAFRQTILDQANEVLILQIQTGCEGLNLQEHYSEIYFVSPHWNPCVEDQAIARCHRIGQKKEVFVYRFNMENFYVEDQDLLKTNIETRVYQVQNHKRLIANEIMAF